MFDMDEETGKKLGLSLREAVLLSFVWHISKGKAYGDWVRFSLGGFIRRHPLVGSERSVRRSWGKLVESGLVEEEHRYGTKYVRLTVVGMSICVGRKKADVKEKRIEVENKYLSAYNKMMVGHGWVKAVHSDELGRRIRANQFKGLTRRRWYIALKKMVVLGYVGDIWYALDKWKDVLRKRVDLSDVKREGGVWKKEGSIPTNLLKSGGC